MKKYLLILLSLILICCYSKAQTLDTIPNGGFEHWEGQQNCQYYIPMPWENYCTDYTGFVFKTFPPPTFPPYKDTAMLYLFSADYRKPNFVEQTFILHSRPKSFSMIAGYNSNFYWSGFNVVVLMLKGKDTVAFNSESSDPKMHPAGGGDTARPFDFVFPIKYYNNSVPDYCFIRLNGVSHQYPQYYGGVLYADDVKFLDTVMEKGVWHADTTTQKDTTKHAAIEYNIVQSPPQLNVWPNPSSGEVNFNFIANSSGTYTLYIYDATGRLVCTPSKQYMQNGKVAQTVWECAYCNSGIYTYVLQSPCGAVHGKVVLLK